MKHEVKLIKGIVKSRKAEYEAVLDKYSGNKYKVVECNDCPQMVGRFVAYGHELVKRSYYKG